MLCLNPVHIKNPRGAGKMVVSCGHCLPCRIRRRQEWTLRLEHEKQYWKKSCFVTLTYDPKYLFDNCVAKKPLQEYLQGLRNFLRGEHRTIKYFACGEYGGQFGRKHYHAIIFGLSVEECKLLSKRYWAKGIVCVKSCVSETIRYVAGYVCDKLTPRRNMQKFGEFPPFQLQSQGLGLSWAVAHRDDLVRDKCVHQGKFSCCIPRYYLKKLFPDRDGDDEWFYNDLHDKVQASINKFCLENGIDVRCADINDRGWIDNSYFEAQMKLSIAKTEGMIKRMNVRRKYEDWLSFDDFVDETNGYFHHSTRLTAKQIFEIMYKVDKKAA